MGPQGPQGVGGPQGPQGPVGPAGLTQGAHVSGPASGVPAGLGFIAPTVNVTIATAGQSIFATSQRGLGANGAAATNLSLWICYRNGGGPLTQVGFGALGLRVPANTRVNFPMTAVITGLAPGTYTVGLCGASTDSASWNSNDPNGSTSAVVF